MEPTIKPVLDLTSLVDRISPKKRKIVTLYKLFSAIQQLHPESEEALQNAYREYRQKPDAFREFGSSVGDLPESASFPEALREAGGEALLEALKHWAESMNLARWARRRANEEETEPLEEYSLLLGYAVLRERYALEGGKGEVAFHDVYDELQRKTVLASPERDLPSLNAESNRLKLPLFDPTRHTAEGFRSTCADLVEEYVRQVDRHYGALGYERSDQERTSGGVKSAKAASSHRSRRMRAEQQKFARVVWDVLTAETLEKAAFLAAEHNYLIEESTLRLAIKEIATPIFSGEGRAIFALVDGKLYSRPLGDDSKLTKRES